MTKGNELYYEYRKKLNKENNTRKVYKREDDQGSGTRNERYINDVLGGEGQAVSAQPAPPVAPAKTRESLLSEYRSALGQRMAAQSPQQTLMNVAESRVQFDQQQAARRRQTNSGPMRSAQPTIPEQMLPGSPYIGTGNSLGRYGKGNIDLYNRPQYRNPDGSVSTVRSISIGTDDGEVLIPTVGRDANGRPRLMSDDEAIDEYFRTGNNLGTFKTIEEADDYADRLHKQQEAYYTGKGRELPSLEQMANPMRYAETRRQTAGGNSTVESSTVDRMLQAAKQSEARAAEQKEQTYQRNAVNAFGNPNARAGGNWHTTPTGAWGAQDQTGRLVSPQSQRYEQDYRDTDPMRRLAAERVSAQDAENPLNTRGNTKPYSVMTDDEKSVYNYLYSTYGPARAEEYHNGLMDEINRRIGQENYEANTKDLNTAQKALRSYQQGFSSGIEGILNAPAALVGAENRRARSAAEYENSALRSDQGNNTAQKILYDIASSTGNMTPGMMASALGAPAAVGSTLFATSAGGNAYAEAMNAGEDVSTSRAYAVQQFADEEATNWLLGGINAFGGGAVRKVMQNSAAGRTLDAAVNRLVKTESGRRMLHMMMDYVGDMAGEAQQEYVQFYTENFTKAILGMKDEDGNPVDFNFNPADPDALYAALLGALNAGALNAAPAAARVIHGSGTDVQNAGGLAEDLRSTTREDYTSDAAYDSAMRLEAVAREIGERQAAGRSPSAMDRIAFNEAMSEFIEASTEAEAESEEENPRTGFVDESGLTLQEITEGARQLREAENRTDSPGAEPSEAEPSRMTIPAEMKEQAAYDLLETRRPERIQWTDGTGTFVMQREADEGYSVTNQMGETSGLTEDQAAQMLPADTELTITWGEQRQEEQVKPTVTPESLPSYEASAPVAGINARTENINTGVDNRLMALAQDVTQERTQQKAAQMQSVYDAGKNMQAENLRSVMNGATMLTEQEKQAALQRGMQEAVTAARTQTAQATNAAVQKIRIPGVKEGKVSYDPKVDQSKLTEGQKVNAALAGAFASKVFGANVVLTQSNVVNGRYEGANGWFRFGGADDQTFYFDVNAGKNRVSDWKNSPFDATSVMPVIAHEGTHWMEKNHPEAYKGLESQVLDALSKDKAYTRNGELSLDDIISLEQKRMDREEPHADGRPHTVEEAKAELVARGCEDMLNGNEYAKAAFSDLDVEAKKTLWGHIKGVFESIQRFFDELLKNYRSNSQEARAIRRNKEAYAELLKTYGEILGMGREETASADSQNTLAEELAKSEDGVASDGVTMSGEASVQFNERIYEKSGREYLINWLANQDDISQADRDDIVAQIDHVYNIMQQIKEETEDLADYRVWANVEERNGRLTVITPNGEYPLNIDFATVCKKRKALDFILNKMVTDGDLDAKALAGADIVRLQDLIKSEGLEIACALCFVDSKRYRIGSWADSIVNGESRKGGKKYGYNELVRSLVPEGSNLKIDQFNYTGRDVKQPRGKLLKNADDSQLDFSLIDKVIAENKPGTWNRILATALKEKPELRSLLNSAELLSSVGFDPIRINNPALFDIINNAGGSSKPKLSFSETPYLNDILMSDAMTPEQAYSVGGVRIQSFSDFMANMVFDYVQMVGELQAKKLPAHAYTKEAAFVAMFGKTGIKINMSLVPKATTWSKEKVNEYLKQFKNKQERNRARKRLSDMAGLDANGNYIWEDETFPYEVAMHLQADPEYAKNCGTIAVGVSMKHIYKLLNDPTIQMVIPYHKSGINPVVARMRGIDLYTDFTKYQNTRYRNGRKISAKDNTFDFYATLAETKDPKATADAYLKWCDENDFIPKFDKFRKNPNYYKLLADFRLYDETGAYAPQGPVRGIYPDNMKDLILNGYSYTGANGVEYHNGGLKAAQEVSDKLRNRADSIIAQYKGGQKALQDAVNSVNESSPNIASEVSIQRSSRITDTELIDRLDKEVESGDYITTYKAMQVIDGELYPPMAAKVKGPDGKYRMQNASKLGEWQQADEDPAHIKIKNGKGYYTLNKGNGKSIDAAYNPYEHSSNLVLNDQFEEAYKRDNLVTVECRIPKSEIDNPYHAEYAKDSTGVLDWKAGVVAGKLKNNKRQVYLSRYLMPVRILEESEVASMWKDTLAGSDVSVPFNVVSPKLLTALENAGVSIDYEGSPNYRAHHSQVQYSMRDSSGQELTEAQAEYFKDSKVRDEDGNLLRVYHGTNAEFYEFDRDKIGAHGSYEGAGFNFTPSSTRAGGYKGIGGGEGRVMEGYLNITNPLSAEKKTMTVRQLAKLIEKIDPTGDDLISNYAQDTRDYGKPSFVKREALYTARQMMNYHDSDVDIYSDLSASGASTSAIIDAFKTLGYDGLIHYDSEGKINTLIAFDSNQFKNIDNKAPTESADIRHSSRNASSDLNLLKAERLSEKYVKELEDTISERDTQIAELQEQMEKAVGAEKEKRKQKLAKLRKEKNDRIAYLEKSYRVNLNWQIAEMRQKMDRAIGEEKAQAKERLDALRAQKNQKIEEILQKNREQREQRRFNRSAQELIKRARRLKKMKGSPTFRAQVDALIGDLDLISPGMKDNTRQRLQKLKEEVDAQAALDPDYAKYEAVKYDKFLDRLKKKQIKDMTLEDIISIAEALAALEHSKKTADREIKEGQGKLFADYGRTAVAQLKKTKGINYGNEIGSMLGKYRLNMLNPTRAFQLLDGYQKGGVFTYFAKELNDGQTRAAEFRQKAEAMFQEIDNNPNLVNDFAKQNIEIMTVEGMKKISKGMRISLYLHAKNLDNVKHISYGGITIPNESLYKRGKYSEAYTAGETVHLIPQDSKNPDMMAAKAIRAITDQMTPEEKQYADIAYKFLNETTKEAINEVSLALDGYEKATVEDYFPIRSDPNFTQASMEGLQKDGTIEGMGMLKERIGSRNPILLEDASQVVLRQKNNTAMYYGLAIPIRNLNRFYNYTGTGFARSVKQSVGKTWGAAGQKYIDNVISDLQFGRQTQRTILDSMKGLYAGTTLNLNLGVSIKQSASYPFAASVIGWAPLAKALGQRFTAEDRAYMDSITPWGYMRRTGFSGTEMGEVARQRTGIDNNQTIQKAKTMLDFIRRVDVATTEKLFKACENYVQEKYPDLEVRGEEYGKKLAEVYNETLQRTQPSYDVMQRNEFLRSQNDLTKVLGAFKTQTFNMGGEILDAYGKWRAHSEYAKIDSSYETMAKESGKAFRTTVAATIVAQAMLVALSAVANAVLHKMKPYRDDKGEVTAESLAKKVMQDFATSFAGLTMGGSEAQAAVMAVFGAEKWYDIEYPGLSMINELVSSITDFSTAVRKSLDKDNAKAAEDRQKASVRLGKILMQVFKLKGVPSQNIYNIANMVYLHGQDLANGEFGSFTAGEGLFGLTDTSLTKEQWARKALAMADVDDFSEAGRALRETNKENLEKAMGRKISEGVFKRFLEDPENLSKYLVTTGKTGYEPKLTDVPDEGFSSFTQLREALGDPEREQNWHHIVEQEQGPGEKNFGTFKATQVNNVNNIVSIPSGTKSPHSAISQYYGSVQDFTNGKTVREWLKDKSFEEQFKFGMEQLQKYGDVVPTSKGWLFVADKEKIEELIPMTAGKNVEKTDTQKKWEFKLAEASEDGSLTDREIRDTALTMMTEGLSADEALELYKSKKKKDEKLDQWGGDFTDYLKSRNAIDEAKQIKDKDQKKRAVENYLRTYHGNREDELLLWKLAGYSENTFEYH